MCSPWAGDEADDVGALVPQTTILDGGSDEEDDDNYDDGAADEEEEQEEDGESEEEEESDDENEMVVLDPDHVSCKLGGTKNVKYNPPLVVHY